MFDVSRLNQVSGGQVPVLEEGVHHAAVDDAEGQPHQHGHNVLSESAGEAVFRHGHDAPAQDGAAVTCQQVQREGGAGVEQHLLHLKDPKPD